MLPSPRGHASRASDSGQAQMTPDYSRQFLREYTQLIYKLRWFSTVATVSPVLRLSTHDTNTFDDDLQVITNEVVFPTCLDSLISDQAALSVQSS